jgi:hypothetical protein
MAGVLYDVKMGDRWQVALFEPLLQRNDGVVFAHQEKNRAGKFS